MASEGHDHHHDQHDDPHGDQDGDQHGDQDGDEAPDALGATAIDDVTARDIERLSRLLALGMLTREQYEQALSRLFEG